MSEPDLSEHMLQYKYNTLSGIARDKVIDKYLRMEFELDAKLGKGDPLIKQIVQRVKAKQEALEIQTDRFNGNLVFLTIRPMPEISFTQFEDVVKNIFAKKWIKRAVYVIEQAGETLETAGIGFHMHAIIFRDGKKFHEIVNEILNTSKKIVVPHKKEKHNKQQITTGPFHIVVRPHTVENNEHIHNYLLGAKEPKEKHLKQKMDIVFREKLKLKSYYKIGEWDEGTILNKDM